MSLRSIALVFFLLPVLPVRAAILTVGSSGCDHASLSSAIAAANPGDELRLRAQTFSGVSQLINKSLTIRGGYSVCGDAIPGSGRVSVLEGTNTSNVFSIGGGATTVVDLGNLEITGGRDALFGGAISILSGAALRLGSVEIHGNNGGSGGAIFVGPSSLLEHSGPVTIRDNNAVAGGGIYISSGASADFTTGGFNPVSIVDNAAQRGGGIFVNDGGQLRSDSNRLLTIESNQAQNGGGLFAGTSAQIELAADRVTNNLASIAGGGMFVAGDGSPVALPSIVIDADTVFSSNQAALGGGAAFGPGGGYQARIAAEFRVNSATHAGGGLHVDGNGVLDLTSVLLSSNDAGTHGGGAYLGHSAIQADFIGVNFNTAGLDGGGLFITGLTSVRVTGQLVNRGNAADRSGGGIAVHEGAFLQVDGGSGRLSLLMLDNTALTGSGGGLQVLNARVDLVGAQIGSLTLGNEAVAGQGGGAHIDTDLNWSIRDSWINGNRSASAGSALFIAGEGDFDLGGVPVGLRAPRGAQHCFPSLLDPGRYCAEVRGNRSAVGASAIVISGSAAAQRRLFDLAVLDNVTGNPASGIWVDAPGVVLSDVLLARNSGSAAVFVSSGLQTAFEHVSLLYNESGLRTGGNTTLAIDQSMIWGNGGSSGFEPGVGSIVNGSCNLGRSLELPDAVFAHPRLITTARGLYRLSDQSPALDACVLALSDTDLDGENRPQGSGHDIGALEGGWGTSEVLLSDSFESGPVASPRL